MRDCLHVWISELSQRTGIPVDTIKHYLRVGVVPAGEPVGPLRAEYDRVPRARPVLAHRALHEVGRLSLDQIRRDLRLHRRVARPACATPSGTRTTCSRPT